MVFMPAAWAVAQMSGPTSSPTPAATPQQSEAAPERVIKFLEVNFTSPSSWTCPAQATSGSQTATPSTAAASCLTCTNTAEGSSEVVLTRPQNAEPETLSVPTGSGVQICGEVLTVKQTDGITTPSTAATSGAVSNIVQ
jgi:hypothetical protein